MRIESRTAPTDWFTTFDVVESPASTRLFAFPFAGGGASVFCKWAGQFADCDVYAATLPGRGRRLSEPPIDHIDTLIDALVPNMLEVTDRPFAFFGHSLGALVAFELARRLRAYGREPAHLIVAGFRAPNLPNRNPVLHHLSDKELMEALTRYEGASRVGIENAQLLEILLQMLRADFRVNETYIYASQLRLSCPITAVAGTRDPICSKSEMLEWSNQTDGDFYFEEIDAQHFFVEQLMHTLSQRPIVPQRAYRAVVKTKSLRHEH